MKHNFITIKSAVSIVMLLMLTLSSAITMLPSAFAHTPPDDKLTYAYLSVAPDPIGIGQRLFVVMWLDSVLPGATVQNDIRFHDFKLTITKPDGNS